MEITDKELCEEIKEYCKLNGLKFHDFTNKLLKEAFVREKYGAAPPFATPKPIKKCTFVETQAKPIPQPLQTIVVKEEMKEEPVKEEVIEIQKPVEETKVKPKKHTLH